MGFALFALLNPAVQKLNNCSPAIVEASAVLK